MKKYDLVKADTTWVLKHKQEVIKKLGTVKTETVTKLAKVITKEGGGSVKIRNTDGTISEERTYPRSADPKRSKG